MKRAALWAALSGALNLAWEIGQLPLYRIYEDGDFRMIVYAVAHCTLGDVLIALGFYGVAVLATRNSRWPMERPVLGGAIVVLTGTLYTAFSEWLNVSVRGSWEYAEGMPTVLGIGLSPLLQWLVVPMLSVFFIRRAHGT